MSLSRGLGLAVRVLAVLALVAGVYFAYTVWSTERAKRESAVSSRAIESLTKVVKQKPSDPKARVLLAQAYAAQGRLNAATDEFNNALRLDKKSFDALEGIGLIAMRQGEWSTAEGYWQRAIDQLKENQYASQDQRLERTLYYLGLTQIELKDYEDAVGSLKEALRIRRDAADTYYALSVAYRELGAPDMQRQQLKWALSFIPTLPEANYDMGLLLLKDGDTAGAAELFRRSADNAPDRAEPKDALAKLGTAKQHLDKAVSLRKENAKAALVEARIAAAIDPSSVEAARLVAVLLEEAKSKAEALAAYKRVLTLVPNDPTATAAIKRLK